MNKLLALNSFMSPITVIHALNERSDITASSQRIPYTEFIININDDLNNVFSKMLFTDVVEVAKMNDSPKDNIVVYD
ncbi:hypothetical protein KSF78_0001615 [Schistosoma japonicum]|nr:hypothetical protein KSF78_0001615 [Schistosoma japonicum]